MTTFKDPVQQMKLIHSVVQPLPLPASRTFASCHSGTLHLINSHSPHPHSPALWEPLFLLPVATDLRHVWLVTWGEAPRVERAWLHLWRLFLFPSTHCSLCPSPAPLPPQRLPTTQPETAPPASPLPGPAFPTLAIP